MKTGPHYFVGAYAASSSTGNWDPVQESAYFAALRELQQLRGLEHPFHGSLHRDDSDWFLNNIRPDWEFLLTCIPGTMERLKADPHFGLASADREGRVAALAFVKQAQVAVEQLNDFLGRQAVVSVLLHSAPSRGSPGVSSSRSRLAESLSQIREWDWNGADISIEHCDAFNPIWAPAKGFLSLEDEISALRQTEQCRTACGVLINWGRSVLEKRDVTAPLEHLALAKNSGVLNGLMFSGVCASDPVYGSWSDSHAPFASQYPNSLMTRTAVSAALAIAGSPSVLGFKIQALPQTLSLQERLNLLKASLEFLNQCERTSR
ncbi:MAG TPA: DUF4862 domain-containing protein [Bdellovibrionales bacterium]|nr:MAG: hypothetical protein A2Z97_01355 [Bdellovibrionales bacterium GWB1_52_6]OFZ04980.1 MAG: hypothetical protein A2X97_00065 [Bdellovibrionales bacterium GWA1_52_35]OFZ42564.1 MAG: hypothetical protein A2070_10570 [Bdellovibrionales bacterium GWC1_52_8]HAR41185.1 DUF4862 domain-containing protein [Bdellovibrionales bacterium]HCM41210.1 DUF4862 domain-containing protein [Bdellovibrionales bacterium]